MANSPSFNALKDTMLSASDEDDDKDNNKGGHEADDDDDDDDDDYLSAKSDIIPSPPPSHPLSQQFPMKNPSQKIHRSPAPVTHSSDSAAAAAEDLTPSEYLPPKPILAARSPVKTKTLPSKPSIIVRSTTVAGALQKPYLAKRGRSVGFVDDLRISSSSSDLADGNGKRYDGSSKAAMGLPRPGILSQRKQSVDSASRSSHRSYGTSSTGAATNTRYTLDEVISSQFESEATTHILAALEAAETEESRDRLDSMERGWTDSASGLLGEGIDEQSDYFGTGPSGSSGMSGEGEEAGMEDYSEDDDEFVGVPPPPPTKDDESLSSNSPGYSPRPVQVINDPFLQTVHRLNDQAQYKLDPYSVGDTSSPSRQKFDASTHSSATGYFPRSPNSAVLTFEGNRARTMSGASGANIATDEMVECQDTSNHSGSHVGRQIDLDDVGEGSDNGTSLHTSNKTKNTAETNTTATLADRLRSLQRGKSTFVSRRSSRRSSTSEVGAGAIGAKPKTSGDKLIDALDRVEQPKYSQWWRRAKAEYKQLIEPRYPQLKKSVSYTLFFIVFPCLFVALILFYLCGNPMAGETNTSLSWWIMFLGVRQMIILEFTKIGDIFWIDIMALRSSFFNTAVGPYISLTFIMSKGWPYVIFFWAILDFCFLYGDGPFPKHWLFWQDLFGVFNADNPVDGITDSDAYLRFLISMIFVGAIVSLKRLGISLYLGRRTVEHFGSELEKVMAKMILIGEVANLAKDIEMDSSFYSRSMSPTNGDDEDEKIVRFREFVQNDETSSMDSPRKSDRKSFDQSISISTKVASEQKTPLRPNHTPQSNSDTLDEKHNDAASSSANAKLIYLLSEWEEPEIFMQKKTKASVQDLLQFRRAVSYMDDKCPFSHAFGPAKTREMCVESSQKVYERLMTSTKSGTSALPFTVFSVLATDESGELVDDKMRSLIRLFRPDRQGALTKLDFVKSIDSVYKELRLLRASIANSAQIDLAFERIVNFFFYSIVAIIAVSIWGINIWALFLSASTFFIGFSFLFGSAASNYFEGLLLIFLRRPYDIGDRIATSNPATDTNPNGSSTWFVEQVSLFSTTVRFATTNEVATYSNGSLASLRIINANRSPKAIVSIVIKFGLETPFQRIKVFRTAVENFVNARPREWVALVGFRATRVEADFGYVEYKIVCQHREAWQNIGPILQSKADLSSFCLEVSKKLEMRYESPPMPVNLTASGMNFRGLLEDLDIVNSGVDEFENELRQQMMTEKSLSADDLQDVAALFEIREK